MILSPVLSASFLIFFLRSLLTSQSGSCSPKRFKREIFQRGEIVATFRIKAGKYIFLYTFAFFYKNFICAIWQAFQQAVNFVLFFRLFLLAHHFSIASRNSFRLLLGSKIKVFITMSALQVYLSCSRNSP